MQILEASSWGLRASRMRLTRPSGGSAITLFPMLHIGEDSFYKVVYADAFSQDVVLMEGIDSPVTKHITRSYRWIKGSRVSDLIVQPRPPRGMDCVVDVINSDLTRAEFDQAWRAVPLWMRLAVMVLAPIVGLRMRGRTREQIARGLSLEDAPSQKELIDWSPETGMLHHVILDLRDERLNQHLDEQIDADTAKSVAVVYGARHMRSVLRHLIAKRGFTKIETDWMTVFSI